MSCHVCVNSIHDFLSIFPFVGSLPISLKFSWLKLSSCVCIYMYIYMFIHVLCFFGFVFVLLHRDNDVIWNFCCGIVNDIDKPLCFIFAVASITLIILRRRR